MSPSARALVRAIRESLELAGDPARAIGQQRYMKSEMPYRGVTMPGVREICNRAVAGQEPLEERAYWDSVLELWRNASYREERYAAMELLGARAYKKYQTLEALPVYEEMIVSGAWWDYVDLIAAHRVGALVRLYPDPMKKTMRRWARDPDMWRRRSAILCQLDAKQSTDLALLYDCIEPSIASKQFFLRKAIGWALRQYARIDPDEVRRYVRENETRLSNLSKREALKNIGVGD